MSDISLRELRNDTSRVLRRAEAGEYLTVHVNRRPVAQIAPLPEGNAWIDSATFESRIRGSQTDSALTEELRELSPDTIADL